MKTLLAALLILPLIISCSNGLDSGSKSSASSCGGVTDVVPPPALPLIAPQKMQIDFSEFKKLNRSLDIVESAKRILNFKNENEETIIPAGTALTVSIDHNCTAQMQFSYDSSVFKRYISESIMSPKVAVIQNAKPEFRKRDHTWRTPFALKASEIEQLVDADPCLISISNAPMAYRLYTPNDTFYSPYQAYLGFINAPTAWNTFYGSNGITSDVIVAVIDDGTQITHPELSNLLWTNTGEIASNGVDDDGNGYIDDVNGYNFTSSLASPAHEGAASHGTHVAGLIGAQENNGAGVSGVMGRKIKIMALNVFGPNAGASAADVNNAIAYAAAKNAKVINMSLGGAGSSSTTQTAMQNAVAAGTTIVIAAGNSTQEITAGNFWYPIGYAKDLGGAIGVGSIETTTGAISSFSNYSTSYVEIAAPGSDANYAGLISTVPTSTYGYKQGTSMASPVVAGGAALAIGLYTSLGYPKTPAQIEAVLEDSASTSSLLTSYIKGGKSLDLSSLANTVTSTVCP